MLTYKSSYMYVFICNGLSRIDSEALGLYECSHIRSEVVSSDNERDNFLLVYDSEKNLGIYI